MPALAALFLVLVGACGRAGLGDHGRSGGASAEAGADDAPPGASQDAGASVPADAGVSLHMDGTGPADAGDGAPRPQASATESLGARCESDDDCAAPLSCLASNSTAIDGSGPPRGICTIRCVPDGSPCTELGATCVKLNRGDEFLQAYCLQRCAPGSAREGFSDEKCHGRPELACLPSPTAGGVCAPNCNADADCGSRHCDPRTGMCIDTPPDGQAVGTACTATDMCRGNCLAIQLPSGFTVVRVCVEACTYGAVPACGWTGTGSPAEAACLTPWKGVAEAGGLGFGDPGWCTQLCDCDDDCAHLSLRCGPIGSAELEEFYGRKGRCWGFSEAESIPCAR